MQSQLIWAGISVTRRQSHLDPAPPGILLRLPD